MIRSLTFSILIALSAVACQQEGKKEATSKKEEEPVLPRYPSADNFGVIDEPDKPVPAWMDPDVQRRSLVDSMVGYIRMEDHENVSRHVIYPKTYQDRDSIVYTLRGDVLEGIIVRFSPPAQEIYLEYYFEGGDMRYARRREWNLRPENAGAREIGIFLEGGEMWFVRERKVDLDIGEAPARIAFRELQPSQRPREVLQKEFEEYWPTVRDLVAKDIAERQSGQ